MTLSITVLGFSGSYAAPGGACSGYLVVSDNSRLWVDCGPGTLANLQHHIDLADLDAILVSHHHPDHFAELPIVYNTYKWYIERTGVRVYGPAPVAEMADAMTGHSTSDVFDWQIVGDGDRIDIDGIEVAFARTDHTVENLAMRFTQGASSIVYTGDTGPGWDLAGFARDAGLLVGEATCLIHQHHDELPHISAAHLGSAAATAGVGTLLPTHIMPSNDPAEHVAEAQAAFGGPTETPIIGHRYDG